MTSPTPEADTAGSQQKNALTPGSLTADAVADYLKNNPDFFVGHDDLLANLAIPHQRGVAISLVERQMGILREHNHELHDRLGKLVEVARDNERLFESSRRLVLALIESKDLEQVTETLRDGLENDFGIQFHALILFNRESVDIPVRTENPDIANSVLDDLLVGANGGQKVVCGCLQDKKLEFLFPDDHEDIGSVAVSPLVFPDSVGVLALGSPDENYFRSSMGSLFLGYLGDVLCRVLARFI